MKKLVGILLALIIALAVVGGGTWAVLQDPESALNNKIAAGTLDLRTNNVNGVTATLTATSLKPNTNVGPQTIVLKNAGTVYGSTLNFSCSYTESDGAQNGTTNMSADDVAKILQVIIMDYNRLDLTSDNYTTDVDGNGYKDLYDVAHTTYPALLGLNYLDEKNFVVQLKMRDGIDNNFQGDGVNITMTFVLNQ
jgi:predicted ribosomally synthesized peptide with SipW-like signal peptide